MQGEHELKATREVEVLFPDHAPRTNSAEHRQVREILIKEQKQPCWICGRTIDDFAGDASKLEIHHLYGEYSEFGNLDPARINQDHPIFAQYNTGAYSDVDDLNGSLVLCALHHRGSQSAGRSPDEGIHYSDFDTWEQQRYLKDDRLHAYFPGVVVIRKGISDESGYLPDFLAAHPEIQN